MDIYERYGIIVVRKIKLGAPSVKTTVLYITALDVAFRK